MRISDWSSDVCSSDLTSQARKTVGFRLGLAATPFGLCPFDIALVVVEATEGDGNPGDQCDIVGLAHEAQAAPHGLLLRCARLLEAHLGACAGDCRFSPLCFDPCQCGWPPGWPLTSACNNIGRT